MTVFENDRVLQQFVVNHGLAEVDLECVVVGLKAWRDLVGTVDELTIREGDLVDSEAVIKDWLV